MMRSPFLPERTGSRSSDTLFVSLLILLIGLGLGILFSASYHRALTVFQDPFYFIRRQAIMVAFGCAAAFIVSRLSLSVFKRYTPFILFATFALMVLCFVPGLSHKIMGARRWILIFGFSFQPSEMAKLSLVLYLAFILEKKKDRLGDTVNSLLPPLIITILLAGLTYFQNDFSTSIFLILIGFSMFFIAEVSLKHMIMMLSAALPLGAYLLFAKAHRVQRLITFLEPGRDPVGADYQVLAAKNALLKGGFWGSGIGQGTRKLGGLPEAHSDFVFAVLAEELGFLGVVIVLFLFLAFAYRGYTIAFQSRDSYSTFLAFGITTSILYQALLNMAVVSGLVPATGIPLPFFSSGGSSVFVTLLMCGILLNLSRRTGLTKGDLHG